MGVETRIIDGRYHVESDLGRGAMGQVVRVRDGYAGNVPRACKLLEDDALRSRFVAEFELLEKLAHPGFVRARELGVDAPSGQTYAVMDLAVGEPLEGPLTDSSFVAIAAALLRAVDHLHRLGQVHGDLAPANILAVDDARFPIRVLDLGAAGERGSGAGSTSGVLAYAAPERLEGGALDPSSDLWSVGATLHQLRYGQHPFPDYPAAGADGAPARPTGRSDATLDPWLERLLAPKPADRFPSAAAALSELEALTGRELPLVPSEDVAARLEHTPFVDVGGTRAALVQRLVTAADAGHPQTIDISGPAGSGRTRLLAELAHALAARGHRVALEPARAGDTPGEPLRRALARLGHALDDRDLRPAAIVTALMDLSGRARGPVALLIDDADRADEVTRATLDALRRTLLVQPERAGALLVVTVGDGGDVELGAWRQADVEALLTAVFAGRRVGRRVAEPIRTRARGNAALTVHVLRALASAGGLTADTTAVHLRDTALDELTLPSSLEDAAASLLEALPEARRQAAAWLGHAREPLPASLLGEAAETLVREGVAVWTASSEPEGEPRVAIASEPLASAARRQLKPSSAHAQLAEAWRGRGGPHGETQAIWHELQVPMEGAISRADEALRSGEGDRGMLVETLVELDWPTTAEGALAGGEAVAAGKPSLAATLYHRAVELAGDDRSVAVRALCELGAIEARQARHVAAVQAFERALERCEAMGERARILAGSSRSAVLSGALDDAERWAREGLDAVGDDLHTRGRLGYTLGLVHWYRGRLDEAEAAFEEALEAIRATGDPVEEGAVVTAKGLVAHRRGDLEGARARYEEAMGIGEEAGDDSRVLTALQNLGVVLHEQGAWTEALDTYREALALAEALEQPGRVIQLAGNLGNLWRYLGELVEARNILQRGLELARREGNRFMEGVILTMLGEVALADEAWERAERLLEQAADATRDAQSATEQVEVWLDLARLHLERQAFSEAREAAATARELARDMDSRALEVQAVALAAAAERRSIHGDMSQATELLNEALEDVDQVTNPDARWPILLEGFYAARDADDLATASRRAGEVRGVLRQLEDAVPARHREAFRTLRERRRAWRHTQCVGGAVSETRREAGERLGESWQRLLEINKRLNTEYDVRRLLEYIMDSAILLTGAERGFLLLAERDGDADEVRFDVRVARNIDQENIRNVRFKISHSIATRVVEQGEAVLTIDAMEDQRYREQLSVHDLKLRSVLCLPMRVGGKVLGAIYLDNRFRRAAFGDGELRFMEAFADQAGIAVNNARLLKARETAYGELEKARDEVESLNERLENELAARTEELEDTHKVVIRQQRQLEQKHGYDNIIGSSRPIRAVFSVMDRLLDNAIPVLIEGESGTGKELVARAIHFNGARKSKPFVAVNCGAIPANLLESELFGHVRGAFTGATADKRGLFEAADGGTLLLDELGELPLEMQVKLLRVLQNGEIKKVGSTRDIKVDVRIIAATNRKLEEEVAEGRFREDLYYRLSVVPIELPPLRERRDDIPELVRHFLTSNREAGLGEVDGVSSDAMTLLQRYSWPGNVRQLEMVLKNASLFADGEMLDVADFQSFPDIVGPERAPATRASLSGRSLQEIERDAIIQALHDNRGNKKRSAEQLGIDRRTLYNKLKAYNIVIEKELKVG